MMKNVAIIGTGTMGPGMAATLARGGMDVACYDTSEAARDRHRLKWPPLNTSWRA